LLRRSYGRGTGVTEYVYWVDKQVPQTIVPVGPDGTASIVFTPPVADYCELHVYARNADGIKSGTTDYLFFVNE